MSTGIDAKIKDALDHVRAAAQELHGAISDAAAKQAGATKADLEAFAKKAKAVTDSAKASIGAQHDVAKKPLTEAAKHLEATQKLLAEAAKSSGEALKTSIAKALAEARASVEKVTEAVAAKRSAESAKKHK